MRKLIKFALLLLLINNYCNSQNWSALGSGMNASYVDALTVYQGELIAAGYFTTAGGISANNIAKWNGSSWSPLGTGMNTVIYALAVYNGELIAGGYFTTAGGDSAKYIAKWNGTSWSSLGSGMNAYVEALIVYNNLLIAGGVFTTAGGITVNRIAKWNGVSWAATGSNITSSTAITAFTVYRDSLFTGGGGFGGGGYILKWTGSVWNTVATMDKDVYVQYVYANELIAGGYFEVINGTIGCSRIAKWNGSSWTPLSSGMIFNNGPSYVYALNIYGNELIAGGRFTGAGGVQASRIAKWNGNVWSPLGSGMNNDVLALTVYGGDLIAGGWFLTAGGITVNRIAKWCCPVGINPTSNEIPYDFSLSQNYPNPFNPQTKIKFDIPQGMKGQTSNVKLIIYDLLGREVATLVNEELKPGSYEVDWDGSNYSSGVYFCKLVSGDFAVTKKMVLMK